MMSRNADRDEFVSCVIVQTVWKVNAWRWYDAQFMRADGVAV